MFYCNLSLAVKQQCFPLKEASDQSYAVDMPEHARTMPVLTGCCLHQTCIGLVMACTAMIALLHIKKINFQVNILIVQLQLYLGDILLFFYIDFFIEIYCQKKTSMLVLHSISFYSCLFLLEKSHEMKAIMPKYLKYLVHKNNGRASSQVVSWETSQTGINNVIRFHELVINFN